MNIMNAIDSVAVVYSLFLILVILTYIALKK